MKKSRFNLDVKSGAQLCPNPSEWYSKAYINKSVTDNFRAIPGVKDSTKVARNVFNNLLKSAGCSWNEVDTDLNAEEISVCKLEALVQICQYDLEESFVANQMIAGDHNWTEQSFLNHFWNELGMAVREELQLIRWNGDSTGSTGTFLDECDGYGKLIPASSAVQYTDSTVTEITAENIISVLTGVVGKLPEAVVANPKDTRIYMSASNALKYQIATLGLNSGFNYTGELPLSFAGIPISVESGMNNDLIVAGNKNQLGYAFDGISDEEEIKIVNLIDTTAEPVLRARIALKAGFKVLFGGDELAYFEA